MRKYYLLFAALVLLILDVRIPAIAYPAYEAFRTEAPVTVSLVIEHVVGSRMRIDLFSDLLGYLLLLAAAAWLSVEDRSFLKCFLWGAASTAMYGYWQIMPFYLNGGLRFRAGYVLYFAAALLKIVAIFLTMYTVSEQLESTSNHSYNNVTVIIMMVCAGSAAVAALMWFFDLTVIAYVYSAVRIAAFGVVVRRIWNDRNLLVEGA